MPGTKSKGRAKTLVITTVLKGLLELVAHSFSESIEGVTTALFVQRYFQHFNGEDGVAVLIHVRVVVQRAGDDVLGGKFVVGGHNGHLEFGHDQHHRLHVLAVHEVFGSHQRLLQDLTQVPGQQTAVLVRRLVLQVLVVLQLLGLGLQLVLHPEQTVLDLLHQRLQRLVPREFRVVPLELLQVLL